MDDAVWSKGEHVNARPALPPTKLHTVGDRLVYAIGDVHGRLDLFRGLIDQIVEDCLVLKPEKAPLIIPLGDYIDRGPDSAGVLELIADICARPGMEVRPLRGNHEQAMLSFLDDATIGPTWARFGGAATLSSYGVTAPRPDDAPKAWEAARLALLDALPPSHLRLLHSTEFLICLEDYVFVHAGLRPEVRIEEQTAQDLMWIRQEFLAHGKWLGKRVVHGHTAQPQAQVLAWRVGIDTGAYATGILTAIRLYRERQTLLHAKLSSAGAPKRNAAPTGSA